MDIRKGFYSRFFKLAVVNVHIVQLVITVSLLAGLVQAAPVEGELDTLEQPDGTVVSVRIWGDEYYQHVESLDGRTLVRDSDTGEICYAKLSEDGEELISTGQRYNGMNKKASRLKAKDKSNRGWKNPVRHKLKKIREIAKKNKVLLEPEQALLPDVPESVSVRNEVIMPVPSIISPTNPLNGSYKGLVLLIDFSDQVATISQSEINNFCNQIGYTGYSNNGSVRDYFNDVSGGAIDYTNHVTAYYRAIHPKSYYEDPAVSYGTRARELVREALNHLENNVGFDFTTLSTYNSTARAINAYYAGNASSGWSKGLWPHKSSGLNWSADGVSCNTYQISDIESAPKLKTFCHENGHMLCWYPDLYDYGGQSRGLGKYCLMAAGGGYYNPVPPNAYLRYTNGWETLTDLSNVYGVTTHTLTSNSNASYFYLNRSNTNEFFIMESRQKTGRNLYLPDEGMMIWHVDRDGSNSNEQMTPASHYLVSLEQADGQFDLENNRSGDSTDLFDFSYPNFDDLTTPNANWWSGANSGLVINNVSSIGATMTFETNSIFPVVMIPGRIESEDYYIGGEGVSYHDATPGNNWNTYRDDDVDIFSILGESGYAIGHVQSSEWLHYTFNVLESGFYSVNIRYATPNPNQQIRLLIDGVELDTVTLPSTGAWENWQVLNVGGYYFQAGAGQVFRVEMISPDSNYIANFDWIQFMLAEGVDMNGDGIANLIDFSMFSDCWQQSGCDRADFDGDGTVEIDDLSYLATLWLRTLGDDIINVDFFDQTAGLFSGQGALADIGNYWNGAAGAVTNCLASDGITVTGINVALDRWNGRHSVGGANDMLKDYYYNAGGTSSTLTISGLVAGTEYTLYLYIASGNDTVFTVDGVSSDTVSFNANNAGYVLTGPGINNSNYTVMYATSDLAGQITVTIAPVAGGTYSGISGLQITPSIP